MAYAMAKVAAFWFMALLVVQVAHVQSARLLSEERSYDTTTAQTSAVVQESELADVATDSNVDQLSSTQTTTPYDYTQSASTTGTDGTDADPEQYNPGQYSTLNGVGTPEDETVPEDTAQTEETYFDQGSADVVGNGGDTNYVFNAQRDANPLQYSTAGDDEPVFTEQTSDNFNEGTGFSGADQVFVLEDQSVAGTDSYSNLPPPVEEFLFNDP